MIGYHILALRLHIGRALVRLGFWIAPDAYWTVFERAIRSAELRRKEGKIR